MTTFCDVVTSRARSEDRSPAPVWYQWRGRGDGAGIRLKPSGGRQSGAGAALSFLALLAACGELESAAPPPQRAAPAAPGVADPAVGITTELDGEAPEFGDAIVAELSGDDAAARAAFGKVLAADDVPAPIAARVGAPSRAARGAYRQARVALDLVARAAALAPAIPRSPMASRASRPTSSRRAAAAICAARGRDDAAGRRCRRSPMRSRLAERALVRVHAIRPHERLEVWAKEDATEDLVAKYRAIAEAGGLAQVAADYRIGSLYHDLALGLLFERQGELRAPAIAYLEERGRARTRRASPGAPLPATPSCGGARRRPICARARRARGGRLDDRGQHRRRARRAGAATHLGVRSRPAVRRRPVRGAAHVAWRRGRSRSPPRSPVRVGARARAARDAARAARAPRCSRTIAAAGAGEHRIRVIATRGRGRAAGALCELGPGRAIVIVEPLPPRPRAISAAIVDWPLPRGRALATRRSRISITCSRASSHAAAGADEAMRLDADGAVAEGATSQRVRRRRGVVATPAARRRRAARRDPRPRARVLRRRSRSRRASTAVSRVRELDAADELLRDERAARRRADHPARRRAGAPAVGARLTAAITTIISSPIIAHGRALPDAGCYSGAARWREILGSCAKRRRRPPPPASTSARSRRISSSRRVEPRDAQWPKRAGETYRRSNRDKDAIEAFTRAADRYAQGGFLVQAIAVCKLILQIDPRNDAALQRIAAMNEQIGAGPTRAATIADNNPNLADNAAVARSARGTQHGDPLDIDEPQRRKTVVAAADRDAAHAHAAEPRARARRSPTSRHRARRRSARTTTPIGCRCRARRRRTRSRSSRWRARRASRSRSPPTLGIDSIDPQDRMPEAFEREDSSGVYVIPIDDEDYSGRGVRSARRAAGRRIEALVVDRGRGAVDVDESTEPELDDLEEIPLPEPRALGLAAAETLASTPLFSGMSQRGARGARRRAPARPAGQWRGAVLRGRSGRRALRDRRRRRLGPGRRARRVSRWRGSARARSSARSR